MGTWPLKEVELKGKCVLKKIIVKILGTRHCQMREVCIHSYKYHKKYHHARDRTAQAARCVITIQDTTWRTISWLYQLEISRVRSNGGFGSIRESATLWSDWDMAAADAILDVESCEMVRWIPCGGVCWARRNG